MHLQIWSWYEFSLQVRLIMKPTLVAGAIWSEKHELKNIYAFPDF